MNVRVDELLRIVLTWDNDGHKKSADKFVSYDIRKGISTRRMDGNNTVSITLISSRSSGGTETIGFIPFNCSTLMLETPSLFLLSWRCSKQSRAPSVATSEGWLPALELRATRGVARLCGRTSPGACPPQTAPRNAPTFARTTSNVFTTARRSGDPTRSWSSAPRRSTRRLRFSRSKFGNRCLTRVGQQWRKRSEA